MTSGVNPSGRVAPFRSARRVIFLAPMSEKHSYEEQTQTNRDENGDGRRLPKKGGGILEFVVILVIAFGLVFGVVRPFIVEAFVIPSASMEPTLHGCPGCTDDRVLANKFIYDFTKPNRGDIIVFKSVTNPKEDLIKRVIGLPGDTIQVKNDVLFLNGKRQKESYISKDPGFQPPYGPEKVPKGHYFMMGDNRGNSYDSRYFGPLPAKNIEGEAFMRFWPLNRIGWL